MLELYKNIKEYRKEAKMSQEELAKKVGYTDRSSIAKIENGDVDLPQSKIIAIAKALGVSASTLMGWEDSPAGTAATAASSDSSVSSIDRRKNQINTYYDRMSDEGKQLLLERSKELLKLGYTESGENDVSRSCFSDDDAEGIA